MDHDPSPESIMAEHPGWKVWEGGMTGRWYAQGPPPGCPVVDEENTTELRARIAAWEETHSPYRM